MVKRFYNGLLALYFSTSMTMLAFTVFIIAFADTRRPEKNLKPWLMAVTAVLAVVMFFYYKNKLAIAKGLHTVENAEEYAQGGMLDRSFILEDRMLLGHGFHCTEIRTSGITDLNAVEKGRKVMLEVTNENGTYTADAADMDEAQRFAAFIQRKNPGCAMNIAPKGNGTLQELGAGVN